MKLPNAHQMRELDNYTIQERDMKSVDLMEEAAKAVADFIQNEYTDHESLLLYFRVRATMVAMVWLWPVC